MTPTAAGRKKQEEIVRDHMELEASGGIDLVNVREIAETGVDYVSIGALTHSAPALDLSMIIDI